MQELLLLLLLALLPACKPDTAAPAISKEAVFNDPVRVAMNGYDGNIMEPFLTRDGNILLFNNLNAPPENTNLHWAIKLNDTSFQYQGEIAGVNTTNLEAVPTLDNTGTLYFVSNRNYTNTLSTLYQCNFLNGIAKNVQLIGGISQLRAGWVNFDVEVSADGQSLYFVDAQFDQSGNPSTADLVLARKSGTGFQRASNSSRVLKNINTGALEYAASISADELELYLTRVPVPFTATSSPEILFSTRQNRNDIFSSPVKIECITGFSEGPTISPDKTRLYYHKKENDKFVLYMVRRK